MGTLGKTSRPALDETDREWIARAIDPLMADSTNPEEKFYLRELRHRILNPAKGRPHPASMKNLSAMHYATKG